MGNETVETKAAILPDPLIEATAADYAEQQSYLTRIDETLVNMHKAVNQMRTAKSQLNTYKKLLKDNEKAKELLEKGDALLERINTWEENLIQPKQKTFQDVVNFSSKLNADFMHLRGFIDVAEPKVTEGAKELFRDNMAEWKTFENEKNAIVGTGMKEYNDMFKALDIPAIILTEE